METWRLQTQLKKIVNHWYWILVFLLLGALLGYGISYLFPSPYRAAANLYIGINIERVNEMEYLIPLAKEEPLNLDDYKNWQLKQVADIVTSREVLEDTLSALQEQDSRWEETSISGLQDQLDVYWYDTGTWQLRGTFPDEKSAITAVDIWLETAQQKLEDLLLVGKEVAEYDAQIQGFNQAEGELLTRLQILRAQQEYLDQWLEDLQTENPSEVLSSELYQEMVSEQESLMSIAARDEFLMDDFPDEGQAVSIYLDWLKTQKMGLEQSIDFLEKQLQELQAERSDLLDSYHEALEDSLGLSANLVLEPMIQETTIKEVRSTGEFTAGGAVLGFLGWLIIGLVRIRLPEKEDV